VERGEHARRVCPLKREGGWRFRREGRGPWNEKKKGRTRGLLHREREKEQAITFFFGERGKGSSLISVTVKGKGGG